MRGRLWLSGGQRPPGISDGVVTVSNDEIAGGLANVDAVIAVGGVAQDSFVFFEEGIHGRPGEGDALLQFNRVGRQFDVLPGALRSALSAGLDGVPGSEPEVAVAGAVFGALEGARSDAGFRKVGYRIAAGLEEDDGVLCFGDPGSTEADAHAPAKRFDIQQPVGQRLRQEESADRSRRERTLLPGQSQCSLL